jgi:16S rRNA processing protein RimM
MRFKLLKEVTMESEREGAVLLHVQSVRFFKKFVIVKFKEYDDINQVERFRGNILTVPREQAVKLEEGEYYIQDLIGIDIVDEDGNKLGKLIDVLQTGANDVYEMERADGGPNVLIPAIKQCILDVNIDTNTMKIHVMDGLM